MNDMKLVIVDSDEELRAQLWELLFLHHCFELAAYLNTTEEAMDYASTHEVDVIFINNQPDEPRKTSQGSFLPIMLMKDHPDIQVIIYGTSPKDACDACRNQCSGYLMLPFDNLSLQLTVNRLRYVFDLQQTKRETSGSGILVKTKSGYHLLRLNDILFIERINRTIRVFTEDSIQTELTGYTMAELERMLVKRNFFRCHQSFIVNLSKISVINADNDAKRYMIRFKGMDGDIMISREKYMEIVNLLREKYANIKP